MYTRNMSAESGLRNCAYESDFRDIKQMLLSGNKDEITLAVGRVLSNMKDGESVIEMITSDICEFLCDAMLPFDPYVSRTIYTCLGIMSQYKPFFTHNHSSFALETVIRALHFIIKSGGHDANLKKPLHVILLIVQGYGKHQVQPERKPFENLIKLLWSLFKMNIVTQEVKYQGGLIINFLFEMKLWKVNDSYNIIQICEKWLQLVSINAGETFQSLTPEMTNLGCSISGRALRYLIKKDDISNYGLLNDNEMYCDEAEETGMVRKIIAFLIENAAPEIQNMVMLNDEQEAETLKNFLTSIIYIFNELFSERSKVAHKLSEMGFIQLLKRFLCPEFMRGSEELAKLCVMLLTEILLTLSDDVFNFPDAWPTGRDHFRKEFTAGMTLLSLNASNWFDKLSDPEVNRSSRLALIIYLYFYLLSANSNSSTEFVYPCAVRLINFSIGVNSTALVIKAVWFIFVMSQMKNNCIPSEDNGLATKKMLDILGNQKELSLVYTHHPALLCWTFSSSRISCKIQYQVVKLWLENQSSDCTVFDDLMKKSAAIRLATFCAILKLSCNIYIGLQQLLQDRFQDHVTHLAFSSLKNFMTRSDDDLLTSNIWFSLPQILAKFTTDSTAVVKVDYIVDLARLRVPDRPDMSKIIRIASLLPDALNKSDLISLSSALGLALQLMEISLKEEDNRVLFAFLRCHPFIRRIINGVSSEFVEVALLSLKIVKIFWNAKFECNILPWNYDKITLDASHLLKVLSSSSAEIIKIGLLLTEEMLISQFESILVAANGITLRFREQLFFSLENVLFKHLPENLNPAWKCLQHSIIQVKSFADDCFLHDVIIQGLIYMKETPEMVEFIIFWMEKKMEGDKSYDGSRRITRNYFLETIKQIALHLADNFNHDYLTLSRTVLTACKHFSVDLNSDPYKRIADRMALPH